MNEWMNEYINKYFVMLSEMMLSHGESVTLPSCQSPIEKSDPNPPQQQEENHEWESKGKPGAKIDDITVWKVTKQQECYQKVNVVIK